MYRDLASATHSTSIPSGGVSCKPNCSLLLRFRFLEQSHTLSDWGRHIFRKFDLFALWLTLLRWSRLHLKKTRWATHRCNNDNQSIIQWRMHQTVFVFYIFRWQESPYKNLEGLAKVPSGIPKMTTFYQETAYSGFLRSMIKIWIWRQIWPRITARWRSSAVFLYITTSCISVILVKISTHSTLLVLNYESFDAVLRQLWLNCSIFSILYLIARYSVLLQRIVKFNVFHIIHLLVGSAPWC